MTHFSQQDNFSVAARVLGALFYYAPESAEAAPLVWGGDRFCTVKNLGDNAGKADE